MEEKLTTDSLKFAKIGDFLNQEGVAESLDEIDSLHKGNSPIATCGCARCVRIRTRRGLAQPERPTEPEEDDDDDNLIDDLINVLTEDDDDEDWP